MTQSGQGEEPSARPAHEGIVLPSDGGEPLLPGMTGGSGGHPTGAQPGGQAPQAATPAGGQAWGQPWGPDQQQPPQQQDQGWQQGWGSPEPYQQQGQWDAQGQAPQHPGAGPLPPENAPSHGAPPYQQPGADPYGVPAPPGHGLPPAGTDPYGVPAPPGHGLPPAGTDPYGAPAHGLPPAGADPYGASGHSVPQGAAHGMPGADEGATQYIPPVPGGPADEGATQFLPPMTGAAVDEGATQYIPPVGPGALPPEASGGGPSPYPRQIPQGAAPGHHPDAEATQFIAPVDAQGGRQTPAEFDNLFRSDAGGAAPATQQLPLIPQGPPDQPHARPASAPPGGYDGDGGRGGRRTGSRVPVIAAVGVGIAVLGIGAGALLSGGDGDSDSADKNTNVAATAPATDDASPSPAADPAREQAVELDKLLADSGSSRASVIKAVADVRNCGNLGQAASDLRSAAEQRKGLVTRLGQLSVDKLPAHAELTAALNKAWKASESADLHYAAWADQAHGKKVCKKGHARDTGETRAGNRESGVASSEKAKAAQLWNAIAKTYGLTQRQPTQL
ncbi:hypothetical protein [Streptomyces sp. NPDC056165]|uniref:hypothetical protein n=1 Tax=Streptomyces sp. NPDC056165 TaxID=3345733 RepID=UPI0035DEFA38